MSVSRILSRISKSSLVHSRATLSLALSHQKQDPFFLPCHFHTLGNSLNKGSLSHVSPLSTLSSVLQRFGMSSSASPEHSEKESTQNGGENVANEGDNGDSTNVDAKNSETIHSGSSSESQSDSVKRRRRGIKRTAFSDSDSEEELSMEEMIKLVAEKDELLLSKQKELETMKDKFLRSYAEMENVTSRTKREAENSKKFAIQSFAKSLLDVADNLDRASSVVKDGFSKIDASEKSTGALPLLKTLLEGVEMTDKQLIKVFKEFGVQKYHPLNEPFDPNMHNAAFQVPDPSKPSNTVAVVLKSGYMLHDRVLRPAEVGVSVGGENNESGEGKESA